MLERTYIAAMQQMMECADQIIETVRDGACLIMEPENSAKLKAIEAEIIETQEAALSTHKQKVALAITKDEYDMRIAELSDRLKNLEEEQNKLQSSATRYAEVKAWLEAFDYQIRTKDKSTLTDPILLKSLVEHIIVKRDRIEVVFKCGGSVEQQYV